VERREFQRLHLESEIPGTYGSAPVSVTEIGVLGARIEHIDPLPEAKAELRFTFEDQPIIMKCEVARSGGSADRHFSGLRFLAALGESGDHLRSMLADLVTKELERKHESSATRLRIRSVDGDKTVRGTDAHFLSFRLEHGAWRKRHVFLPEQPSIGFTVARGEDADEMQRLCAVYEASDEEGRRLIRLFAELSVSDVLQIPPRS
jgi:hypothetical protein